jgi:predicted AAA+ superfamily ATPase
MSFQNPWWVDRKKIYEDEHVKRALTAARRLIVPPMQESVLLMGPRQVGKTTFLKTSVLGLLERGVEPTKILFFSCDSLKDKDQLVALLNQYRSFINSKEAYVFLDEATFIEDWNVGVLHLFNAGYLRDAVLIVSGSTSLSLRKETLPGRPITKKIFYPLNFRVYYDTFYGKKVDLPPTNALDVEAFYGVALKLAPYLNELNRALFEYVKRGGYIATQQVVDDPIHPLYDTYKDAVLSDLAKLNRDERVFREILEKVVDYYGSRVSDNTIAKDTSIGSHNTVASYLELAENLFLLRVFRKIENGRVNYRSLKKVYFTDPFIYRVVKRYTKGFALIEHSEISRVIEGIVGEHLAREYEGTGYTFFKDGREVDFLVGPVGVEVKWGAAKPRDLKVNRGYVLSLDEFGFIDGKAILPVSVFLYTVSSNRILYDLH